MFTKHPGPDVVGSAKSIMAQKRRITIKDIAEMAETSKTTVSFYLNGKTERMSEDTQKRIRRAIEKTGYEPNPLARGMNAKSSKLIGVIIGDVTNEFSNRIVKGIGSVVDKAGYRLLCCSSNYSADGERAYIDRLLALGVDGFIVQPTSQFKTVADDIEAAGKKLVFFDSKYYDYTSSWVKTDNYEATYRTVKSCVERGYRRFLLVAAAPQLLSSRIERFSGFVDALEKEVRDSPGRDRLGGPPPVPSRQHRRRDPNPRLCPQLLGPARNLRGHARVLSAHAQQGGPRGL